MSFYSGLVKVAGITPRQAFKNAARPTGRDLALAVGIAATGFSGGVMTGFLQHAHDSRKRKKKR